MGWLILADDLTGAADAADAFARQGAPTTVGWGESRPDAAGVFAYDAASRGLAAAGAAALRRKHLRSLASPDRRLFLKIDSTLRGQPAAEIRATLETSDTAFGLLAPAFPAMGRTTQDGRIRVHGTPLEATDIWRLEHSYPTAGLVQVLAGEGVRAVAVPLEVVRADHAAFSEALAGIAATAAVAVCDATSDEDLDRIAAAGAALARPPVWIGSGGLSAALARATTPAPAVALALRPRSQGVLTVVGSMAAASRAAAARLADSGSVAHVAVSAEALSRPTFDLGVQVGETLQAGGDVLVALTCEGTPDLAQGARLAEALAIRLAPAAPHAGALVVTGGETARALLGAFGVLGVRLAGGPEPGITLGLTLGQLSVPLITKAGAFGDDGVLLRAVERLRRIKREGIVA